MVPLELCEDYSFSWVSLFSHNKKAAIEQNNLHKINENVVS